MEKKEKKVHGKYRSGEKKRRLEQARHGWWGKVRGVCCFERQAGGEEGGKGGRGWILRSRASCVKVGVMGLYRSRIVGENGFGGGW